MNSKKGFTLIELLAVIVVLALLIFIAVPAVIGVSSKTKQKMYCSKLDDIESAAKLYAEDNGITGSYEITVNDLINNGYLKKENSSCTSNKCVEDPRNSNDHLDEDKINITVNDNRVVAKYAKRSSEGC